MVYNICRFECEKHCYRVKTSIIRPRTPLKWALIVTVLVITGLACAVPGINDTEANQPVVALSRPTVGQTLPAGRETKVQSVSVDGQGVARVELVIDGQVIWVDANANPKPETPFIVAQPWIPDSPGTYVIQARAYNIADVAGESPPLTIEVIAETDISIETPLEETPASGTSSGNIVIRSGTATATKPPVLNGTQKPTNTPTLKPTLENPTPTTTHTPTLTPQAQNFSPTDFEPEGRFKDIWFELGEGNSRLGYPTGPEIKDRNYAKQPFENGLMFWWDNPVDPDYIWVLDSPAPGFQGGTTSNLFPDTWDGSGDGYSCDTARNGGPVRGFGKVWCEHTELQSRLGYPSEPEAGSGGNPPYAQVLFFQGGVMFYAPSSKAIYVLFSQGDWQRFDY